MFGVWPQEDGDDDDDDGDDGGGDGGSNVDEEQNGDNDGEDGGETMSVVEAREIFFNGLLERAEAQFGIGLSEDDYKELADALYNLQNADNYEVLAQSFCNVVRSTLHG